MNENDSKKYNNNKYETNSKVPWKLTLPDEFANVTFINDNTYSGRISRKMMEGEGVYRWSNGAQYKVIIKFFNSYPVDYRFRGGNRMILGDPIESLWLYPGNMKNHQNYKVGKFNFELGFTYLWKNVHLFMKNNRKLGASFLLIMRS